MYAETGLIYQTFSPDFQQFCDQSYSHKSNACLGSSGISDYDLGGEGDLFKAPEPIMEQPVITFNPMTVINGGEDDYFPQHLNDKLLINVFNEYKEILENETSPISEAFVNYKYPVETDEISIVQESVHLPGQITKSVSFDCLNSMNRVIQEPPQAESGLINIAEVEFGNVFAMRRAFSDGDIKTLANGDGNHRRLSLGQSQLASDNIIEERWQKLSRYRNKKKKRNFGKKIKYACRKALADNQPRIRGRFAKTEES